MFAFQLHIQNIDKSFKLRGMAYCLKSCINSFLCLSTTYAYMRINKHISKKQKIKCIWFRVSKQVFSINAVGSVGKFGNDLKQDEIKLYISIIIYKFSNSKKAYVHYSYKISMEIFKTRCFQSLFIRIYCWYL